MHKVISIVMVVMALAGCSHANISKGVGVSTGNNTHEVAADGSLIGFNASVKQFGFRAE